MKKKKPLAAISYTKKHDGNYYGVYEIPLGISDSATDASFDIIRKEHDFLRSRLRNNEPMRKKHGELTGRARRFKKRDELIRKLAKNTNGLPEKALFTYINNELVRRKWSKLSKIRLQRIIRQ